MLWVFHATVINADQGLDEALSDQADLSKSQAAIVELTVAEPLFDQVANEVFDVRRSRFVERSTSASTASDIINTAASFDLGLGPG